MSLHLGSVEMDSTRDDYLGEALVFTMQKGKGKHQFL